MICSGNESFVSQASIDGKLQLIKKIPYEPDITIEIIRMLNAEILCNKPNKRLYDWKGRLKIMSKRNQCVDLSISNLALKGSILVDNDWAIGVTIYVGEDSKNGYKVRPIEPIDIEQDISHHFLFLLGFLSCVSVIYAIVRVSMAL